MPESRKIIFSFQFLFTVDSVVNNTGNDFWDLALFLFEPKVKEALHSFCHILF